MSSVRAVALFVVVALLCWLVWPTGSATDAPADRAPPKRSLGAPVTFASTAPPALPGADGVSTDGVAASSVELVRVEGLVVDEAKAPIGGATVRIGARATLTEADGSFAFDAVPEGALRVTAELGELYGEESTTAYADTDPIEISVRRGSTLVLHVVAQGTGAPIAGANVSVAYRDLVTDATGTIRARGLDPTGERLIVTAEGFASRRERLELDPEHPTATRELTIALASGAPVSGVVIDERGARVPEANVTLRAVDETWTAYATTDEHGGFSIPAIAPGKHALSASSARHLATPDLILAHDGVHPTTGVEVHVTLGAELVGRVLDAQGAPVAGAQILGASAESGPDGRFVATGLDPGELTVSARKDSLASAEQKVTVAPGRPASVQLVVREASIAGRVVDSKGLPIADASLYARANDDSMSFTASTDEYGKFDFGGITPGEYKIMVQHAEEISRHIPDEPNVVAHTGRRDLTIVLSSLTTITGRVVLDGRPVGYYGVSITRTPDKLYAEHVATVSDEAGAFSRSDIAPGTWGVVIVGPDFATKVIPDVVTREGRTTDLGTIEVERGRVVRGRVTDASGRPVAGAFVAAGSSLGTIATSRIDQRTQGDTTTRTDADGRYLLAGLPGDDLRIVARDGVRTSIERDLAPADTEVDLVVQEVGTVVGHIANMQAPQSSVFLASAGEDARATSGARYRGSIDRAGDFRVTGVPAGTYSARVIGDNSLAERTVTVVANEVARVDFAMPAVQIELVVAIRDCSILTLSGGDTNQLEVCDEGVARFHAVGPGSYRVCAMSDERCAPVTVRDAPATQRTEVTLLAE